MNTVELSVPGISNLETPSWSLARLFGSNDLAMDLGTANTLIYVKNRGIVLNEPSIVAVDEATGRALAVGHAAKEMFGKTAQKVRCVRPMKDGVIADFEKTALMIKYMIAQVRKRWALQKPQIIIGVPSGITQVEKRAVIDAAMCAGVRSVMLVEEPMAAALGAGLPVDQAVLCMNGTLYSHSIRVAGDEMDEAIQRQLKRVCGLEVGIFEAERLKLTLGSALPFGKTLMTVASGRDVTSSLPRQVEITDDIIREALQEPIAAIIESLVTALEQTRPEIAQDIISRGIHIAGGGALLRGLCERLHRETGIRFFKAQDPLSCVVRGVGRIVDNLKEMKALCIN
jgi:rod shape-determining protein MreB and related proteins